MKGNWYKNNFVSKLQSRLMPRTSLPWLVPAVTCRRERYMAKYTLTSSNFETVSSFVQATQMVDRFAIVVEETGDEEVGCGRKNGCFVSTWNDGGVWQCPVCLLFDCLRI